MGGRVAMARARNRDKQNSEPQQEARSIGWHTTDADEVALRRLRGEGGVVSIDNVEPRQRVFSTYRVHSASGAWYTVEIRSLTDLENTCSCPDWRTNGLGTCKHIEAVLAALARRRPGANRSRPRSRHSSRVEIFLRRGEQDEVMLSRPKRPCIEEEAVELLRGYFDEDSRLRGDPAEAIPALKRSLESASPAVRRRVRVSRDLVDWATDHARRAAREIDRQQLLADVQDGRRSLDILSQPLYPYQVEGMLHLTFTERALLADEMGLGKTVQAVGACSLLRRLRGVQRVLVVCPVSLKAEWEEQIGKFTDLPLRLLEGRATSRLATYDDPAFFTIANYEQVVRDVGEINSRLRPEIVILDEAQRIKNWNTKTARQLKRLQSRYAFLLTGTPIENRIDEIYSIVDFLDPQIFGPLFRFNREFYQLDDRGRPVGYRNLGELRRRIRPLLLRRRKDQVEGQLPGRVDNNYFVAMTSTQLDMYDDFKAQVARLVAIARRRILLPKEQEKLQKFLACMRMVCDTPYILTRDNRDCPKLGELEAVLEDLDVRNQRKAVIFSEWRRMLELVGGLLQRMGLGFAWHTGDLAPPKRREEIRRFKSDPQCRLLLSTDSGGVGLNLQAASVVINLDLPWNPARLEQRIARAWRKHQERSVHVVNLISEGTIEHQMLATLGAKQQLADGILDGRGELGALRMPAAARQGFLDRLRGMMEKEIGTERTAATPPASVAERLRRAVEPDLATKVVDVEVVKGAEASPSAAIVILQEESDTSTGAVREAWTRLADAGTVPHMVETVDQHTWETIQRLARAGLLSAIAQGSVTAS